MAVSDWDVYTGGGVTVTTDMSDPIVDSSSLDVTNTNNNRFLMVPKPSSGLTTGITTGFIRSIFRMDSVSAGGHSSDTRMGLSCMQSAVDVSSSGACYVARLKFGASFSGQELSLNRINSGGINSTGIKLVFTTPSFSLDTEFTLQLKFLDLTSLSGGVLLSLSVGSALNYTDLTETLVYQDFESPHTTSFGEGIWGRCTTFGSSNYSFTADQTQLYTIS